LAQPVLEQWTPGSLLIFFSQVQVNLSVSPMQIGLKGFPVTTQQVFEID
jgi:hypothetical protein